MQNARLSDGADGAFHAIVRDGVYYRAKGDPFSGLHATDEPVAIENIGRLENTVVEERL